MLRLLVVDQSLKNFEGHHHDLTRAVIQAAAEQGWSPNLACHVDFPQDELAGASIIGRFSRNWNESNRPWSLRLARHVLERLPDIVSHRLLASIPARDSAPERPNLDFARRLQEILIEWNGSASDHVFIHTLGAAEFLGLAEALSTGYNIVPHLHVTLRYNGQATMRDAFAQLEAAQARISFWTDTEQLAEQYREIGCPKIGILPIPHGLPPSFTKRLTHSRPITLGYLGGARSDKGFHRLPAIIDALTPRIKSGEICFLIHTYFSFSRERGVMARALAHLQRAVDGVTLLEKPLDTLAFQDALSRCDALILPYDMQTYQRRSSGLLIQAMAVGIPVFVPADTWLAAEAVPEACIIVPNADSFAGSIEAALSDFKSLQTAALAAAPLVRLRHDAHRLVDCLLRHD